MSLGLLLLLLIGLGAVLLMALNGRIAGMTAMRASAPKAMRLKSASCVTLRPNSSVNCAASFLACA